MVGERVLDLCSEIINHLSVDPDLEQVVGIAPFVILEEINHTFDELEEAGFRVAGDDNQQTQELKEHISNKRNAISIEILVNSC